MSDTTVWRRGEAKEKAQWDCMVCQMPLTDYEPDYCCNGYLCGCQGMPMTPWVCSSEKCTAAIYDTKGVGGNIEERLSAYDIELYSVTTDGAKTNAN